jgi:hypothetical protein
MKTYLLVAADGEPITTLTGVSELRVTLTNTIRETWGVPTIFSYNKKDIPNPEGVNNPGIVMHIENLTDDTFTDGMGRVFRYEEL